MNFKFKDKPPMQHIYVRFSTEDLERLREVAKAENTKLSEVIRVLTLAALDEYKKDN